MDSGASVAGLSVPARDVAQILAFLNHPRTDLRVLDEEVGLDVRAARNILAHRAGPDGRYPSADDDRFDDLEELDGVTWVGEGAIARIWEHVLLHPVSVPLVVEGVSFDAWEAAVTVWGVNQATFSELDAEVGLHAPAAQNLTAFGPYESLEQIAQVEEVATGTLERLRGHAPVWLRRHHGAMDPGARDAIDAPPEALDGLVEQLGLAEEH